MIIEVVRLVVTLAATAAGFLIGHSSPGWIAGSADADAAVIVGAVIGAGVGYVAGGFLGRLLRRSLERSPELVAPATGPQLFAGAFGLLAGVLVGAVVAVPAIMLTPPIIGWSSGALVVVVLASFGASIFSARADDLLAAAGLGARRGRPAEPDERPMIGEFVVDSSAAIDGRILDLARAGLVTGKIWVPGFVLDELQGIADSGQKDRRHRGRRGLEILDAVGNLPRVELCTDERTFPEYQEVDAKLLGLCMASEATLVTTDHNLGAAAGLRGIAVLNPHALGESMRRVPVAGETMSLLVEKEGTEPGQGVGYLDDGTMVVIEGGAARVGEKVEIEVFSAMRTSIGRIVFARMGI